MQAESVSLPSGIWLLLFLYNDRHHRNVRPQGMPFFFRPSKSRFYEQNLWKRMEKYFSAPASSFWSHFHWVGHRRKQLQRRNHHHYLHGFTFLEVLPNLSSQSTDLTAPAFFTAFFHSQKLRICWRGIEAKRRRLITKGWECFADWRDLTRPAIAEEPRVIIPLLQETAVAESNRVVMSPTWQGSTLGSKYL